VVASRHTTKPSFTIEEGKEGISSGKGSSENANPKEPIRVPHRIANGKKPPSLQHLHHLFEKSRDLSSKEMLALAVEEKRKAAKRKGQKPVKTTKKPESVPQTINEMDEGKDDERETEGFYSMEIVLRDVERARQELDRIVLEMEVTQGLIEKNKRREQGIRSPPPPQNNSISSSPSFANRFKPVETPNRLPKPPIASPPRGAVNEVVYLRAKNADLKRQIGILKQQQIESSRNLKKRRGNSRRGSQNDKIDIKAFRLEVEEKVKLLDAKTRYLKQKADVDFDSSKLRKLKEDFELKNEKYSDLLNLNKRYRQQLEERKISLKDQLSKISEYESQLKEARDDIDSLSQRLKAADVVTSDSQEKIRELEEQLASAEMARRQLQRKLVRRDEFLGLESRMERVAKMRVLDLLQRADNLKTEILNLNLHKKRWDGLQSRNDDLLANLKSSKSSEMLWRQKASNLQKELERMKGANLHALAMLETEQRRGLSKLLVTMRNIDKM